MQTLTVCVSIIGDKENKYSIYYQRQYQEYHWSDRQSFLSERLDYFRVARPYEEPEQSTFGPATYTLTATTDKTWVYIPYL